MTHFSDCAQPGIVKASLSPWVKPGLKPGSIQGHPCFLRCHLSIIIIHERVQDRFRVILAHHGIILASLSSMRESSTNSGSSLLTQVSYKHYYHYGWSQNKFRVIPAHSGLIYALLSSTIESRTNSESSLLTQVSSERTFFKIINEWTQDWFGSSLLVLVPS